MNTLANFCFLALLALAVEAAVGYPDRLWRRIGHPVSWIGRLIALLDRRLNKPDLPAQSLRDRGVLAIGLVLFVVGVVAGGLTLALFRFLPGFLLLTLASSSLLAQRSLHSHVRAVATALASSLEEGRAAVAHIVGRDVAALDEAGVARAAIESLAENFSDGVVAPAFWLCLAGPTGGALYKAANTADNMIGHRTPRFEHFGWAAARLDDWLNWPASRLSGCLIVAAAALKPGASPREAWAAMARDAPRHRSPNAGWPEAAMAGALGLKLAGPRSYGGRIVPDAFMGDGRREANAADIRDALAVYRRATGLLWLLVAFAALVLV